MRPPLHYQLHITLTAWRHISSGIVLMAIVGRSRNARAVARENDPDGAEVRSAIEVLIGLQTPSKFDP